MKISIPKETGKDEKRVACTPETVKKFIKLGYSVHVQQGAGKDASYTDDAFSDAGAEIAKTKAELFKDAHIILCVGPLSKTDCQNLGKKTIVIGLLNLYQNQDVIDAACDNDLILMALELLPRISRAQSMDALSSQANLAGYKAVLDACAHYDRAMPMMMTAAGTIAPARVFVMGAGVAGLQAIATARRLGAIVSATDVRPAAKEQVQSLGATFVAVEDEEFKEAETAGGYAKEMSAEYKKKQTALIEETIAKQDIVITTALIPGKPAPKLVTDKMIKSMKPGSVIVDMAVTQGGNVEGSKYGEVIQKHNATLIGHSNIPARIAADASSLYARNLYNLVAGFTRSEDEGSKNAGTFAPDWDDDILKGLTITKDGKVVHEKFERGAASASKPSGKEDPSTKKTKKKETPSEKETKDGNTSGKKKAG